MAFENALPPQFGFHTPSPFVARLIRETRKSGKSWFSKRKAFLLRALALRLMRGQPVDVESLGLSLRLFPQNNTCEKRLLFTPQYFDPLELQFLERYFKHDFVFLDIGANIGGYSLFVASRAGLDARIIAVEPQPELFQRLIFNASANGLANIEAVQCALADRDGELTLYMDPNNKGEASIKIRAGMADATIRVPGATLLSLMRSKNLTRVDAAKLDVERAEDLVLRPFLAQAPKDLWPKVLLFERSEVSPSLIEDLKGCGYREVFSSKPGGKGNVGFELA